MSWTEDRVELLKKLWAEGFSASQIATQMGGVTRNAVIGKAHRLKLASRTKSQPRTRKTAAADKTDSKLVSPKVQTSKKQKPKTENERPTAAAAQPKTARRPSGGGGHVVGATALKMDYLADAVAEEEQKIQPQENVVVAMSRKLNLMQLTENTCKWPVGDPLSEDFYFCGADSGESGPYCACHSKLAYNSSFQKKRS